MHTYNLTIWIWLLIPLIFLQIGLFVAAMIHLLRKDTPSSEKVYWFLLIYFLNIIGPILYFIIASGKIGEEAERKQREAQGQNNKY